MKEGRKKGRKKCVDAESLTKEENNRKLKSRTKYKESGKGRKQEGKEARRQRKKEGKK